MKKPIIAACATLCLSLLAAPLQAEEPSVLAEAMEEYLAFTKYGSSVILPEFTFFLPAHLDDEALNIELGSLPFAFYSHFIRTLFSLYRVELT